MKSQNPFVIILRTNFLAMDEFFKIKKTIDLGIKNIVELVREYLTKRSVKNEIKITSINLEIE